MSAPAGTPTGEFAGRYAIERELGRGGTAIVYLAHDAEYERPVAIKVLRPELTEIVTANRFLREIQLTAQLQHPHIVPVLHSGTFNGRLYYTLPYMDGGTLRDKLKANKQLPIPEVLALGETILSALAFAHKRNLLHRDVKPENILYAGGQACLSDFGIARAVEATADESTTSTGLVRGTPAYMSPEQAAGVRDIDARSDLYSLACVLYEALAGVPAFVGASSQALVAQRISYEPRPVRIYRSAVSPGLEAVLAKALATTPADRYQSAEEFAQALAAAPLSGSLETPISVRKRRRAIVVAAAAAAVVIVAVAFSRSSGIFGGLLDPALDTTRVAILPFEGALQPGDSARAEDLLFEGLHRWRGLNLVQSFELGDALRRGGPPTTIDDARRFAGSLSAGRFIRGRVGTVGGKRLLAATLVDTRTARVLHDVRLLVPPESAVSFAVFRRLGDSLMLRSRNTDSPLDTAAANASLPATQLMIRASDALRDWDLHRAESLYVRALEFDPASARAALWIAQLRAWQEAPRSTFAELARRAANDSLSLAGDERLLAPALAALSAGELPAACESYRRMTVRSPRQFAGWYGLGRCRDLDRLVIADPASPTKWRYRSSYNAAIDAYSHAFSLLPSVFQSYQGAAFARLRSLLFTSDRFRRPGTTAGPDPSFFVAVPTLEGDTITFWPQPISQVQLGRSLADPQKVAAAVQHNRATYRRITAGWSSAFPSSPGAKEAYALSLEIQGDPASMDSIRAARRLSTDPAQRLRLDAELVWLLVKFGIPDDTVRLVEARRLADSALRMSTPFDVATSDYLGRLAALLGRCARLGQLSRSAAAPIPAPLPQTQATSADVKERTALVALGCRVPAALPTLDQIAAQAGLVAHGGIALEPSLRAATQAILFSSAVRNTEPLDTAWAKVLAPSDFLIASRLDVNRGLPDSARKRMLAVESSRRGLVPGDLTPDAALPESRLWLALGDVPRAGGVLDRSLLNARFFSPMDAQEGVDNFVIAASLVRAMAMRAELSQTSAERAKWARAVVILWAQADPELQPVVDRMRVLSNQK